MYEIRQIVTLSAVMQKYSTAARCSTDDITHFLYQNKFRLNSQLQRCFTSLLRGLRTGIWS